MPTVTAQRKDSTEVAPAFILLVDDRPANLATLEAVLAPLGQRLVMATSGREALDQTVGQEFAVIILDLMMAGMDGIETAVRIKLEPKNRRTPLIFLSALDEEERRTREVYELGAVDYIRKPFDGAILRAKVAVFVELHQSREEIKRQAAILRRQEVEGQALRLEVARIEGARAVAEAQRLTYAALAESIPQQVWAATPDGALDYINSVGVIYFARTSAEILGAGWQAVLHPDDLGGCVDRWLHSLGTGEPYEVEFRLRRHDGDYRWHLGRAVAIRDDDGRIRRWFGTNTDIHDRIHAEAQLREREQALRESEARLRLAMDAGHMADWEWVVATGKIVWSPALERLRGIPEGSFPGTMEAAISDIHPDDKAGVLEISARNAAAGRPHRLSYRIITPAGEIRWIETQGRVVMDDDGKAVRLVGVLTDVTERKVAEELSRRLEGEAAARRAAEAAESEARQVLESISDPFFILDPRWVVTYVSRQGAELLSRTVDDLVGQNIWEAFPRAVGGAFYEGYHRARAQGRPVSFEAYFPPLGLWFEVRAYPTPDGRLVVHYRDISARKAVETQRAREERQTALRADIGTALTHVASLRGLLQVCCQAIVDRLGVAFARIWSLNAETQTLELEASAGLYSHLDGPHGRVPVGKFKIGLIAAERRAHVTNDVAHDDRVGDPAWAAREHMVAFAGYPLIGDDRCLGVLAMFAREPLAADTLEALAGLADTISQGVARKLAEESLAQRAQELARSNADLERFAYVASHDLQEPLRMVTSYTQLLGRRYRGKLDADADDFIGFAVDGVERMQALINDLLAFSRVGTKATPLKPTPLEGSLTAALANLRTAVAESGAVISHDPLPTVSADPPQMVQLFQNLVANAIKFHGTGPPHIHVSAVAEAGGLWRLAVTDDGIGIEPVFFERLFVLFQRLHTRTDYPGNGIGLAICKRIVERHGGTIGVESSAGHGSTFFFTLKEDAK